MNSTSSVVILPTKEISGGCGWRYTMKPVRFSHMLSAEELKRLLTPFGITTFYTDAWGVYSRNLPVTNHTIGKSNTQRIERKNLTLRTRIKRLTRKTICFSKSVTMYDIVVGFVINFIEFSYFHILIDKLF